MTQTAASGQTQRPSCKVLRESGVILVAKCKYTRESNDVYYVKQICHTIVPMFITFKV